MTFDLQPTLHGPIVDLRPLRPADDEALLEVASDPLIWDPGNIRSQRAVAEIGAVRDPMPDPAGRLVFRIHADPERCVVRTVSKPAAPRREADPGLLLWR